MAKEIDKIIQSKTTPKSKNVLWDNGENLKINRNGKWESIGGGVPMLNVKYAELVDLRNNNKLIAGMQYRIIDYVTTTAQENTQSAGHQFDVIVTADNENTLNEVARACFHEGDTYFSEAGANLAAWQIWYSLDNDIEKFVWADTTNGKGVIYRMIDEWNNDIPYDFKNILFVDMEKYLIRAEANYFDNWWAGDLIRNSSLDKQTGPHSCYYAWILVNVSGPGSSDVWYTDSDFIQSADTIFYEYDGNDFYVSETIRIINLALGQKQYTFGNALSPDNELSEFVDYSIGENNCHNNIIKPFVETNKQNLNAIILGNMCYYNSFGYNCYNNSFGNDCTNNRFDNGCYKNSFNNNCTGNSLDNNCHENSFGNYCSSNSFNNNCFKNTFNDYCRYNSFGINCYSNSFNESCYSNRFGNDCSNIELSTGTTYKTVSINSNDEVKIFNLADLVELLN